MSIFKDWLELDLTRAARTSKLARAYEIDDSLQELANTIDAGLNAFVVGEAGVGKTALTYELVARSREGNGARRLHGRRVLQISLKRRLASLATKHAIHEEVQKLFEGIRKLRSAPVLFIRDLGLAYDLDLEDKLASLACSSDVILIGEGSEESVSSLLEYEAALRQQFGIVRVPEPDLDRAVRIVRHWAARREGARFSAHAVEQSVALSHRFLARSRLPRNAIDLLRHTATDMKAGTHVTSNAVIQRLSTQFRIPRVLVDPTVQLDLAELNRSLSRTVVGQRKAVSAVVDTIGVIKAGLTDQRRPLGAMLFPGPTGVGKTLVAQTIATQLFGRRDRLIRFNMADYQSESDAALLFGVTDHHNKAVRRGQLTSRMAGHSLGVLLLDEFEKSHPSIHDRFLQLLDEGEFTNAAEERVSCRSFVIIVTTNAGFAHGEAKSLGFRAGTPRQGALMDELAGHFRYELLNRFDRIVSFQALTREDTRGIVIEELKQLQLRIGLRQLGITLEVERRAVDLLVLLGHDVDCGARYLRRTIEQEVTTSIARLLVNGCRQASKRIRIVVDNGAISSRFVFPPFESKERSLECDLASKRAGSDSSVQHTRRKESFLSRTQDPAAAVVG